MEISPNPCPTTGFAQKHRRPVCGGSPEGESRTPIEAQPVSATCVAEAAWRAYLMRREPSRPPQRDGFRMPQLPSPPIALPRPMVALAALVAVLVAGAAVLWAHYGTAVFYEMVAAGVAWCL